MEPQNTAPAKKYRFLRFCIRYRRIIGGAVLLWAIGSFIYDLLNPSVQVDLWFPIFTCLFSYVCFFPEIRSTLPPLKAIGVLSVLLSVDAAVKFLPHLLPALFFPSLLITAATHYLPAFALPLLFGMVCFTPDSRRHLLWCWGIYFAASTFSYFLEPFPLEPWDGLFRLNYYYSNYGDFSYDINRLLFFPLLSTLVAYCQPNQLNPRLLSHRRSVFPIGCLVLLFLDWLHAFLFEAFCDSGYVVLAAIYLLDWVQYILFVFLSVLGAEWLLRKLKALVRHIKTRISQ